MHINIPIGESLKDVDLIPDTYGGYIQPVLSISVDKPLAVINPVHHASEHHPTIGFNSVTGEVTAGDSITSSPTSMVGVPSVQVEKYKNFALGAKIVVDTTTKFSINVECLPLFIFKKGTEFTLGLGEPFHFVPTKQETIFFYDSGASGEDRLHLPIFKGQTLGADKLCFIFMVMQNTVNSNSLIERGFAEVSDAFIKLY